MRACRPLSLVLLALSTGCGFGPRGFVYTDMTYPLVTNMERTPVGSKEARISTKKIKEPVSGLNVSVEWNSRAIGDAARQAGMERIYYADLHTISVLGGLWEEREIVVVGE